MPGVESLRETLEYYRQRRQEKLAELQGIELMIRQLEGELGEAPSEGESAAPIALPQLERPLGTSVGRKPEIRPDQFFGKTHAEAAREYLKLLGRAISFEELSEALQKGGCKLSGANAKKVLYISLVRNAKDFAVPQKGYIGLREFYPKLRQQRAEAKKTKAHPPRKARTGGRRRRANEEAAKEQPEAEQ